MNISRYSTVQDVSVTASLATTEAIQYAGFAYGTVYVPTGSSLTSLTWYAAEDADGEYVAVYDGATTAATSTVAQTRAVPIPAHCQGAGYLKAVGNTTGTVAVSLKA